MLKADKITKVLKGNEVLSNISYTFENGKIYLLTGHNGCGKTMLLRALCGLITPDSGEIICDKKCNFGVVIETPKFMENETGYFNLCYLASIRNIINKDTSYRTCISTQKSPEICKNLPEYTCKMQTICKNKPLKSSYSIKRERYGVLSYAGLYVGNHDCHWSTVWSSNRKSGSCDPGCFRQCRGGSIHLYYHDRCHVLVGGTDADCKRGGAY